MSDDPNTLKDLMVSTGTQHGWVVAVLSTSWAVILRALVGKHLRDRDLIKDRLKVIEDLLIRQDERLNNIEDRSHQRRREDHGSLSRKSHD